MKVVTIETINIQRTVVILNDNCLVCLSNSDIMKVLRVILRDGTAKLRDHATIHHHYNSLFLYKPIRHLNCECEHMTNVFGENYSKAQSASSKSTSTRKMYQR